jgi:hypothetical protein
MKTPCHYKTAGGLLLVLLLTGCVSSGRQNAPTDRAVYEHMQTQVQPYQRADGSADPRYITNALRLGGAGRPDPGPYFDPPSLNGRTR